MHKHLIRDITLLGQSRQLDPFPDWRLITWRWGNDFFSRLRRWLWRNLKSPVSVRWMPGLRVFIYPNEEISRSIFVTGVYEPNSFVFLDKLLSTGMTFVDVGANMGLYTLFASRKVGSTGVVLALEPSQREFERLKKNTMLNQLTNTRLKNIAVSNCSTKAELLIARDDHPGHNTLGAFGYDTVELQHTEIVSIERLDNVIEQECLSQIDVIKMDIEGAEFLALQGAKEIISQYRPSLLLELSDRTLNLQGCNSQQVWKFLTRFGYHIYLFNKATGLPVPAQRQPYFDAENIIAVPDHLVETLNHAFIK